MWVRKVPGTRAGVEPGLGLRQALGQALAVMNISKLLSCCFKTNKIETVVIIVIAHIFQNVENNSRF